MVPLMMPRMPSAGVVVTPADVLPVLPPGPVGRPGSRFPVTCSSGYLQAVPLIANDVGLATLLVQEPLETVRDAGAGRDGAVVAGVGEGGVLPVWEKPPLKLLVIFSSPGKVKVSDQPLMVVVPVLLMTTWAVKPPGQELLRV